MWEYVFEQMTAAGFAQQNVFWPDLDWETEQALLHHLFTIACLRGLLTGDRVERFLNDVSAVYAPGCCGKHADCGSEAYDMVSATRSLLHMDDVLSPLSVMMFGRSLLPDHDRELLQEALDENCRPDDQLSWGAQAG